jgi:putative selenate reductase
VGLTPLPLGALLRRADRDLAGGTSLFGLPARRFWAPAPAPADLSVRIHGRPAATPFGPAAGPHSQLAQNIALSWLAGARVIELKTVQVRDDLVIPRPCIDMRTVGYNVEWSQELTLEQSLEEYVKAAMLVRLLAASGRLPAGAGTGDTVFDLSVGYDLAGLRSPRVEAFVAGLTDARPTIDRLRRDIPSAFGAWRDLDFPAQICATATLSTFHGCPPGEIRAMAAHLMREHGLACTVKLNPTLLGPADARALLHDALGFDEVVVPEDAFARDLRWDDLCAMAEALDAEARQLGTGFGLKLTNTLVVENRAGFLAPGEREAYLSGAPLHVLAVELLHRVRTAFGTRFPLSFSAGVDAGNFADTLALGLAPVTACTDLLRPGGYGRTAAYFRRLSERMASIGATTIDELVILGHGCAREALAAAGAAAAIGADQRAAAGAALDSGTPLRDAGLHAATLAAWRRAAEPLNAATYAEAVRRDPRYARARNATPPRKIGRALWLLDCLTCDKCLPVCPNDALFTAVVPAVPLPRATARMGPDGRWSVSILPPLVPAEPHQILVFDGFCNDCGNCDVFCPEDGGPHRTKPRLFATEADWRRAAPQPGLVLSPAGRGPRVLGRDDGREREVVLDGGLAHYTGEGFRVRFDPADPAGSLAGSAGPGVEVDLGWPLVMLALREAVMAPGAVSYLTCLEDP